MEWTRRSNGSRYEKLIIRDTLHWYQNSCEIECNSELADGLALCTDAESSI